MQWYNTKLVLPELHFISETLSMSKVYPCWITDKHGDKYLGTGFLVKYLEEVEPYWVVDNGQDYPVTHWIDSEGPNE